MSKSKIIEQIKIEEKELQEILSSLKLTAENENTIPKDGRIASNLIVKTKELGSVVIRVYPKTMPEKLETGNIDFEIEVLSFLSDKKVITPKPLKFSNGKFIFETENYRVFAYPLIPGNTISKEELSVSIAAKAGQYISEIIDYSMKFNSRLTTLAPTGDLEYIDKIFSKRLEQFHQLKDSKDLKEMFEFNAQKSLRDMLSKTPRGFVHADFFFENFVIDHNGQAGLIDFGDCYYGHVIMDIAIGAMEFSAVTEDKWDFEMFSAFINANAEFLLKYEINANSFIDLMRANCLRFAIYTIPFTIKESLPIETNGYIVRFHYLNNENVIKKITKVIFN